MTTIARISSAVRRSNTGRLVGLVVALILAVVIAIAPLGDWWGGIQIGGFGLGLFATMTAVLLAVWRAPRLIWASHAIAVREAIVFALLAVPLGALLVAVGGMVEIVVTHSDVRILAPLAASMFGMLLIGPAVLLVTIPFTVVWSEVVRAALRRVLEEEPEHISADVGTKLTLRAYLSGEGLSRDPIRTAVARIVRHDPAQE
jgi:hypothetical protein